MVLRVESRSVKYIQILNIMKRERKQAFRYIYIYWTIEEVIFPKHKIIAAIEEDVKSN